MKSLSTKVRRNFLVLVRIKLRGKRNWTVPISLWALEETLEAVSDLTWLGQKLLRLWQRHLMKSSQNKWVSYAAQIPANVPIDLVVEILRDLRRQPRFRIVEVEEDAYRVYIDLF